jgi:hypothetical protein
VSSSDTGVQLLPAAQQRKSAVKTALFQVVTAKK